MAVFSQEKRHSQKITTSHHQGICSSHPKEQALHRHAHDASSSTAESALASAPNSTAASCLFELPASASSCPASTENYCCAAQRSSGRGLPESAPPSPSGQPIGSASYSSA